MLRGKRLEIRFVREIAQEIPVELASESEDRQGIDFFMHADGKNVVAGQITFFPEFAFDVKKSARAALRKGLPLVYVKLERAGSIRKATKILLENKDLSSHECLLVVERSGRILHKRVPLQELISLDLVPEGYSSKG